MPPTVMMLNCLGSGLCRVPGPWSWGTRPPSTPRGPQPTGTPSPSSSVGVPTQQTTWALGPSWPGSSPLTAPASRGPPPTPPAVTGWPGSSHWWRPPPSTRGRCSLPGWWTSTGEEQLQNYFTKLKHSPDQTDTSPSPPVPPWTAWTVCACCGPPSPPPPTAGTPGTAPGTVSPRALGCRQHRPLMT